LQLQPATVANITPRPQLPGAACFVDGQVVVQQER
jgi:hypothetical protein